MMSGIKPAETLAALRQLASLGLPGKTPLPGLIQVLRTLVGSDTWGVVYLDVYYHVADVQTSTNVPISLLIDYTDNFHNSRDSSAACGMAVKAIMKADFGDISRLCHCSHYIAPSECDICFAVMSGRPNTETARELSIQPLSMIRRMKQLNMRMDGHFGAKNNWFSALLTKMNGSCCKNSKNRSQKLRAAYKSKQLFWARTSEIIA